jgi:putative transposase
MVEPGEHLARCMVYIALNMVRCGVVSHPREWPWCGYTEHMGVRKRNCVVDQEAVCRLLNGATPETFRRFYEERVAERIARDQIEREALWTQSIAVGSQPYVERISGCLTGRQKLNITPEGDSWVILESPPPYRTF